ncbi:putative siderochrome-iron transporter [Aspergillus fischeri NRRL 181]|uniref:Siderochrome-iron transporter MirC n=1 Tax=Neosartorya fischeri (strain ATCC 1020 / DSM 3700 / CBS 544.65 / FGSC A1164 / JCM 1740 / NRRL 181 / WB 181) TaxID=331117 RepID=A1DJJ4_NEOFI|nr:siderochrome-iron transporter MirC [Aspergillus fischeri NRRL 181]EAW16883.1 siderochrome-iron transporter MirC [Aspergillus fischeri NRRL 181]
MGLDPSIIRNTNLIEDRLSNPEDAQDSTHNEVRELNDELASVTRIEVIDSVISPRSKCVLYAGELDNSTVSTYRNFAASEFGQLSMLATLNTVTSIVAAVSKPPIAKLSDVLGRAETYIITVTCYVLSYILCASARSLDTYAGGCVLYALGQSGTSILNAIVISDISSMRWRGFVYNILYLPFLVTPWISAFIIESVVNGIGWRWGIGMFAILMPSCASIIIISLLVFQHHAKKTGSVVCHRPSLHGFCSGIDLGGIAILTCGFSSLLIPTTLAATTTSRWKTPWIDALIVLGAVFLACLYPYEKYIAKNPVFSVRYFHTLSVLVPVGLACIDNIGFGTTHTYLYAWSMVSHNFSPRTAQFLTWTSGVMQALSGICMGLLMYRLRRYKWTAVAGAIVRLIGYGLMIRLRTNTSSLAELFLTQLIQGLGSGIIETVAIVAAQISVPHSELAQVTSLVMLGAFVGNAVGSAIAGGIYTGKLRERLHVRLGSAIGEARLDQLYNSITGTLPVWGTWQRAAVNHAIFRCLMQTVCVNHAGKVIDIQSVFALVVLVLHRQIEYGFQVSNTTL